LKYGAIESLMILDGVFDIEEEIYEKLTLEYM